MPRKTKEQIAAELAELSREDTPVAHPQLDNRVLQDVSETRHWNPTLKRWEDNLSPL